MQTLTLQNLEEVLEHAELKKPELEKVYELPSEKNFKEMELLNQKYKNAKLISCIDLGADYF